MAEPTTVVNIGTIAPEFRAPTSNGQSLDRDSFLGKVPVVLVFPPDDAVDLGAMLSPFDEHLVEFGHRRVQLLAVVDATAREARELADQAPFLGLTLLADEDGSIREAYAPEGAQCFLIDRAGYVRAVVPIRADSVTVLLHEADELAARGGSPSGRR